MLDWVLTDTDTQETEVLKHDPKGWDELVIQHNRSEKYDGIIQDFSLALAFSCKGGGKEFIDERYESKGSEANIAVRCTKICGSELAVIFNGRINMSSYTQQIKGKQLYTVVDVEKSGITTLVYTREDASVDLLSQTSINGVALSPYILVPYDLTLHSKVIFLRSRHEKTNLFQELGEITTETGTTTNVFHTIGVPLTVSDLEGSIAGVNAWRYGVGLTLSNVDLYAIHDTSNQSPPVVPGTYNYTIDYEGMLRDHLLTGGTRVVNFSFNLRIGQSQTTLTTIATTSGGYTSSSAIVSTPISLHSSGTIDVELGDKIYLYLFITYLNTAGAVPPDDNEIDLTLITDSIEIEFNIDSVVAPSTCKALPIHEAWSRLCEGITDQPLAFKSEFFGRSNSQGLSYTDNGYGSFTAVTDGMRLRGFTQSATPDIEAGTIQKGIITKLSSLFEACNAVWGIGLGIETHNGVEVVRVERKSYFYSDTKIIDIADPLNISMRFVEEICYNQLEIGYAKWKVKVENGLQECNTKANFNMTKIKNVRNQKILTSSFVAGMFAIEITRRENIIYALTKDTEYDDDNFFIALNRSVDGGNIPTSLTTAEKDENITVVSGIDFPETAYNLRFNLASNFDRTMGQFTTGLTKDLPQNINYSYLEGNGQMVFRYTADGHPGDLNGLQSTNVENTFYRSSKHREPDPIFLPEEYTFSYPITFDQYIDIRNNPYGYISFSHGSTIKKGYIKKLAYQVKTGMTDFTLIRKFE